MADLSGNEPRRMTPRTKKIIAIVVTAVLAILVVTNSISQKTADELTEVVDTLTAPEHDVETVKQLYATPGS